jgi:hypothetical protein
MVTGLNGSGGDLSACGVVAHGVSPHVVDGASAWVNSAVAGERRQPVQQRARRARDMRDTAIPLMGVHLFSDTVLPISVSGGGQSPWRA